MATEH